jgi:CHAT domain-containing protein
LNINTLQKPDGSYILDKQEIIVLSNTKELLSPTVSGHSGSKQAALFGSPNFLMKTKTVAETKLHLEPLPFTKIEVENIDTMLINNGWKPKLFLNDDASSDNVKSLQSPELLHIATHGMFEKDVENKKSTLFGGMLSTRYENPLLRSYLLFSGAESAFLDEKKREGVLTAFDAMNMSLENTDLVVLSACQTGLGEIRNGEGVFGLQRAFRVAGAKAVIMSLWTVNDQSTQELMIEFYKEWLNGSTLQNAFRTAQLRLKEKYSDPYFWGAFVLTGGDL